MASLKINKGDTVQVISRQGPRRERQGHPGLPRDATASSSRASTGSRSTPRSARTSAAPRPAASSRPEAPIHVTNVMLVDPGTSKPTRVGYRRETVTKNRPTDAYKSRAASGSPARTGKDI